MRVRNKSSRPSDGAFGDRRLRDEIAADLLDIWIGVSRLMSRLADSPAPPKTGRRATRRRLTIKPGP